MIFNVLWIPKRRFVKRFAVYLDKMTGKPFESFRDYLITFLALISMPSILFLLYMLDIVTLATFKLSALIFFLIFVVFPLGYKFSYKLQRAAVFLNFVHVPFDADYKHPEKYGVENARNFYLVTDEEGVQLGVWQILPSNLPAVEANQTSDQFYEDILGNGQDVIIYYHGNAGTRLTDHRIELYQVLRQYFHVIAFDYRSYGDSSNVDPSEDAIVRDCMFVYKWVANRTKGNLFVWGHSLGTSLAIHALSILQEQNLQPVGVFLEAPFNNMRDEISEFPMAKIFSFLPWFSFVITEPMQENGFTFYTDRFICNVDAPIIILHAEDDHVVPLKLGKKLYEAATKCRRETQGRVTLKIFNARHGYNHKYICRSPELGDIIRGFVLKAVMESRQHS